MKREEFIAKILPACILAEKKSGIPRGWFVSQAIQETGGYGDSDLAVNAHNLYGIKGHEYYQGSVGYAKFKDWDESVDFQAWQLGVERYLKYKSLVVAGKFKEYGDAIQKAGYCALPKPGEKTYGTMIAEIARTYAQYWAVDEPLPIAQAWAVEQEIFNTPVDWDKPVTYNVLAWALYKARGKI